MSEKSSEYLKRTCLICGCHTNQTINIYEPRSGPNIVELIQAKFKFQPLNEDKYLCFSCNNWLINWHSLQTLNSNDAESPSGTFRPQMNSMFHKEKAENQQRQQTQSYEPQSKTNVRLCRPTAKVRPWHITEEVYNHINADRLDLLEKRVFPHDFTEQKILANENKQIPKFQRKNRGTTFYYKKRRVLLKNIRLRRNFRHYKTSTGYTLKRPGQLIKPNVASVVILPIGKVKKEKQHLHPFKKKYYTEYKHAGKVIKKLEYFETETSEINTIRSKSTAINKSEGNIKPSNNNRQNLMRPLVDGKMVSMLRRLGTTLYYETKSAKTSTLLFPRIMSPTKSKPQWTRQLDEGEILLGFDSLISEALPQVSNMMQKKSNGVKYVPEVMAGMQAKRKLSYQVLIGNDDSQRVYPLLPKGLNISLV